MNRVAAEQSSQLMAHRAGLTASGARRSLAGGDRSTAEPRRVLGARPTTQPTTRTISRRNLFKYGAATGAVATVVAATPAASAHDHEIPRVLPAPKPIPEATRSPAGRCCTCSCPGRRR
jgi:hypothetical protein